MLKVVVNGVISESQLTFVKGRQILDDIVIIANKVVDDDKKRYGVGGSSLFCILHFEFVVDALIMGEKSSENIRKY
ncbi:hypothetical protein MTR_2g096770 [Medicago truncatula]|uniref:Reverse transcriptase domain-containing protein n=1 Tax=Medicago truncatula TaxID=3880 RepID=A0A072VCW4_MEDTR|nr:hypothetical protein MTR_2g096770 [Medicago truncatula]